MTYPVTTTIASNDNVDTWLPGDGRTTTNVSAYLANNAVFNVKDFGAVGDGSTDDSTAILLAATEAAAVAQGLDGANAPILYFPPSDGYATYAALTLPPNVDIIMDAPIIYIGSTTPVVAVTIGGNGSSANTSFYRRYRLNVRRATQSDWSSESDIGIKFYNAIGCIFEKVQVERFTIGFQCIGDALGYGTGFAYNKIVLKLLLDCFVGVDLTNANSGFCNENQFFGGRFAITSDIGSGLINSLHYGVRSTSQDGTYNNNSNTFYSPSFELASTTYGICVLIVYGGLNHFLYCRNEGNAYAMRCQNNSRLNYFLSGYDDGIEGGLDDQSSLGGNTVISSQKIPFERLTREIFKLDNIIENYAPYDATHINVAGCSSLTPSTGLPRRQNQTGLTVGATYLQLTASSTQNLGVVVDTSTNKEFAFYINGLTTGFRLVVQCYDASGNILTNSASQYPDVTSLSASQFSYYTSLGGNYNTPVDSIGPYYLRFKPEVASAWIGVSAGTQNGQLTGFSIYTTPGGTAPLVTAGHGAVEYPVVNQSPQTSAVGTWPVGNFFPVATPALGGPIGYLATVAGSPGTWIAGTYTAQASALAKSDVTLNNGSGTAVGTLTNAPAVGNPTKWIPIDDNGVTRYLPAW